MIQATALTKTYRIARPAEGRFSAIRSLFHTEYEEKRAVDAIDFSDKNDVEFDYGGKYSIRLGGPGNTEYKFAMVDSVLSQLLEGDIGIIDVSDGTTAHFRPV